MAEQPLVPATANAANGAPGNGDTAVQSTPARPKRVRPVRFPCVICGRERPARDITQLDVVRPSLFDRIKADNPELPARATSAATISTAFARAMSPNCWGRSAANSPSSSRKWYRVSPTTRRWPKASKPSGSASGSWSCKNALAEALTPRDIGDVAVRGHFLDLAAFPTVDAADADCGDPLMADGFVSVAIMPSWPP